MNEVLAAIRIQRWWAKCTCHRYTSLCKNMTTLFTCVICHDETMEVTHCVNGHPVCVSCSISSADNRCAICRIPKRQSMIAPETLKVLLKTIPFRIRCQTCQHTFRWDLHETHRAWCSMHRFTCPEPGCTHTCTSSNMSNHVAESHKDVVLLKEHTLFAILSHENQGQILCLAFDTVVVISFTYQQMVICESNSMHPQSACRVQFRAYYPSPSSRPITVMASQLSVANCTDPEHAMETFQCGVIPAMLASRENIVIAGSPLMVSPHTRMTRPSLHDEPGTELPRALPMTTSSPMLRAKLLQLGLRDMPQPYTPSEKCVQMEARLCAIMRFQFAKLCDDSTVSELFSS